MASTSGWTHFAGFQLADLYCLKKEKIEILLGVDVYSRILQAGLVKDRPGEPTALKWCLPLARDYAGKNG